MTDDTFQQIPQRPPDVARLYGRQDNWLLDGRPNWDAISFDIYCSRCDYNLRMLVEPRCPECGLQFAWTEVIYRTANRSPWLFEHQYRRRPVRSYLQTVWRSLWPREFWSQVSIHDRVQPGPLWFLLLSAPVLLVGLMFAGAFALWGLVACLDWLFLPNGQASSTSFGTKMFIQDALVREGGAFIIFITAMGVQLAILVQSSSLRQTLGRCRIRPVQILRVVAYAGTPTCLVILGVCAMFALLMFLGLERIPIVAPILAIGLLVSLATVPMIYLAVGLRHYLKLTHARSVAVVSVLVAYLFVGTVAAFIGTH